MRAVPVTEAAAVVAPSTFVEKNTAIVNQLRNNGVKVIAYENGNESSRIEAVNSIEGVRFQRLGNVDEESSGDGKVRKMYDNDNSTDKNTEENTEENKLSYDNIESSDFYKNKDIYSYDFLVAQKPMKILSIPNLSTIFTNGRVISNNIEKTGKKNALSLDESYSDGDGHVFVKNVYTKRRLKITNHTINHGLGGDKRQIQTNARLGSIIGDIAQNAIPINGLNNKASGVEGTYVMVGYGVTPANKEIVAILTVEIRTGNINDVELIDTAHSVSGRMKKGSPAVGNSTLGYGNNPAPIVASTISIADLLDVVNSTHQSILSADVLTHLGEVRDPKGTYSSEVLFQHISSEAQEQAKADELTALRESNRSLKAMDKRRWQMIDYLQRQLDQWKRGGKELDYRGIEDRGERESVPGM